MFVSIFTGISAATGPGSEACAAIVTWFGPAFASNSSASMKTGTAFNQNFGVAFTTGTSGTYSLGWLTIDLNTSSVTTGSGSFQVSLRNTTNTTPYSAAAGTTLFAADTITFTMPTSAATNFTLNLAPADFPNIANYVLSGSTAYSLSLNGAVPVSPVFGLQRTTGYAQNTTNNFYTVNDGFVALNTYSNNVYYTNTTNSYPTLSIAFGTLAVPEPGSCILAVAGLTCLGVVMRRRPKRF